MCMVHATVWVDSSGMQDRSVILHALFSLVELGIGLMYTYAGS